MARFMIDIISLQIRTASFQGRKTQKKNEKETRMVKFVEDWDGL